MVRETSIAVYHRLCEENIIGNKQQEVLKYIVAHPNITDMELAKGLGYEDPNNVRPRRKELCDLNIIIDAGKRKCKITKFTVHQWGLNNQISFDDVIEKQKKIKEFTEETLENGVLTRTIISKTLIEAVGKTMMYAAKYGLKKGTHLKYADYENGIYKIIITRKNKGE